MKLEIPAVKAPPHTTMSSALCAHFSRPYLLYCGCVEDEVMLCKKKKNPLTVVASAVCSALTARKQYTE